MFRIHTIGVTACASPFENWSALEYWGDEVSGIVSLPGNAFINLCGFPGSARWAELGILFLRFPRHATPGAS